MKHPFEIELSKLKIDPQNVRSKHLPDEELIASIAAIGVIEPLVVRPNEKTNDGYLVTNGGMRLTALLEMRKRGVEAPINGTDKKVPVTDDYAVPIFVSERDDKEAAEASLAANIVQVPMHEVDQFEAFSMLNSKYGMKPDVIALRFGIKKSRVEQILALGKLHSEVLKAWRDGLFEDMEAVQAFTLAPDKESQAKVIKQLRKKIESDSPDFRDVIQAYEVKRHFNAEGNFGMNVEFVGIEAFEKRGGKLIRDLFGSEHAPNGKNSEKLAATMAKEKLEEIAESLRNRGWSFAGTAPNDSYNYGRLAIPAYTGNEEERKELERLRAISEGEDTDPDVRAARRKIKELEAALIERAYSPELKAKSGVFIRLLSDGSVEMDFGRITPGAAKAARQASLPVSSKSAAKPSEKVKKAPPKMSNAQIERMSEQLTAAIASTMKTDSSIALAALLAGFGAQEDRGVCVKAGGMERRKSHIFKKRNFASTFPNFLKMGLNEKLDALAQIVAASLDFQTFTGTPPLKVHSAREIAEAFPIAKMQKALLDHFDREDYFASAPKKFVLQAIEETINKDEARKAAGMKRGDLAKFAFRNVPKEWLPPELRIEGYKPPKPAKR